MRGARARGRSAAETPNGLAATCRTLSQRGLSHSWRSTVSSGAAQCGHARETSRQWEARVAVTESPTMAERAAARRVTEKPGRWRARSAASQSIPAAAPAKRG